MTLTPKQARVVLFIRDYRARWGCSPSLPQIGRRFGVGKVAAFELVRAAKAKGALTENRAVAVELLPQRLRLRFAVLGEIG